MLISTEAGSVDYHFELLPESPFLGFHPRAAFRRCLEFPYSPPDRYSLLCLPWRPISHNKRFSVPWFDWRWISVITWGGRAFRRYLIFIRDLAGTKCTVMLRWSLISTSTYRGPWMVVQCYRLGGITSGKAADHWLEFPYFHAFHPSSHPEELNLLRSSLGTDQYPGFD